jgi:2-methylisocitrate lyase-like PEP mutase family enzyme
MGARRARRWLRLVQVVKKIGEAVAARRDPVAPFIVARTDALESEDLIMRCVARTSG